MKMLAVAAVALTLCGCATRPNEIAPAYEDSHQYLGLACDVLAQNRASTATDLRRVSAKQTSKANGDAVGVALFGIPFSKLSGDHEAEVAQVKGHLLAVEGAMRIKQCPLPALQVQQVEYTPPKWHKCTEAWHPEWGPCTKQ